MRSVRCLLLVCATATPLAAQTSEPAVAAETQPADAIVVTGQRAQQERAIATKRDAIGVIDVAAADEIGRLPDRNVAEVVERLPGVGVTYDQGEGRFVAIRGVPSNLNGYTVNGFELGAVDGQTRAVPLDIISGQLLNRVEVQKVKTANQDGQGIGGTINLVTQTAFDFKEPFAIVANAQAGYQDLKQNKTPVRGDALVAKRFGADERFGVVLGGSYSDRTYTSYGFFPDDWRPADGFARGGAPINTKFTRYTLRRQRIGGSGSFDFRPNDRNQFYVRGLYSRFYENEVRPRTRIDFATDAIIARPDFVLNPDGVTGTTGGGTEQRFDLRLDKKTKSTLMGIVGGKSEFGALTLDYGAARVLNKVTDRYPLWQFRCNPGAVDFDFSERIFEATPRTPCTPSQLEFRQYSDFDQRGTEHIWQGKLDAKYALDRLGPDAFLRVGAKYRDSARDFDQDNDVWNRGSAGNRFNAGQFALAGDPINVFPDNSGRVFVDAPTVDRDALRDFTDQNLDGGRFFVRDAATSLANATLADFRLGERVWAGYGEANIPFGAATLTAGLRYERTRLRVTGFQLVDRTTIAPATGGRSYDDFLPSLILRIRPSRDTVFRLAYTRSVGRPEYADLSPGGSVNQAEETAAFGNPNLKPYVSDNADASAEWYFARGGLIGVGVFAKFVRDPIFLGTTTLTDATVGGQSFARLDATHPQNASRGDIIGIEAQFQQQFRFLPGLLSGFGVSLTGTLANSKLRLPDGRTSSFPAQSDYLYGAEIFYQKGPFEGSVAYHNTGKALLAVGDPEFNDQFNNDLRRLDAKASLAVFRDVRVFFEAQNLTDEPTRQYQGGLTDRVIQNERYGRTFYGGVSVKL